MCGVDARKCIYKAHRGSDWDCSSSPSCSSSRPASLRRCASEHLLAHTLENRVPRGMERRGPAQAPRPSPAVVDPWGWAPRPRRRTTRQSTQHTRVAFDRARLVPDVAPPPMWRCNLRSLSFMSTKTETHRIITTITPDRSRASFICRASYTT